MICCWAQLSTRLSRQLLQRSLASQNESFGRSEVQFLCCRLPEEKSVEKEVELKTKQLQLAEFDIQYKRRSVELVELQIVELQRKMGRYEVEAEGENTFTVLKKSEY
uniref:Uncharacterized protein n=1 Tax=Globodera rostochiensis TaxID=31243 RepID=A0A914GSU0_GLORO